MNRSSCLIRGQLLTDAISGGWIQEKLISPVTIPKQASCCVIHISACCDDKRLVFSRLILKKTSFSFPAANLDEIQVPGSALPMPGLNRLSA